MATAIAQPIAGVSANRETEIESVYPSIAGGFLGIVIGTIMGIVSGFPVVGGFLKPVFLAIKLALYVAVGGLLLPLGLLAYAMHKLLGSYYVVTNRSVQKRSFIGGAMSEQLALADFQEIKISDVGGYAFYNAGDVLLQNAQGVTLMTLEAIPYPERLSQILIDARNARLHSDASLANIQARG